PRFSRPWTTTTVSGALASLMMVRSASLFTGQAERCVIDWDRSFIPASHYCSVSTIDYARIRSLAQARRPRRCAVQSLHCGSACGGTPCRLPTVPPFSTCKILLALRIVGLGQGPTSEPIRGPWARRAVGCHLELTRHFHQDLTRPVVMFAGS